MNNQQNRTKKMTTARNISRRRSKLTRVTQILGITLTSTAISFLAFLITLTSSHWIMIIYPPDFFASRQKLFVLRSTYGIIWQCFTARKDKKSTYQNLCDYHQLSIYNRSNTAEETVIGMIRAMYSFSAIFIILLITTFICGLYSIRDQRYTYKRLTGMIYILSAASLVVCIEVLSTIYRDSTAYIPDIYPPNTIYKFGPCYIVAWFIFAQLLLSSFIFFVCSKKRKGTFDEATEEEALANRPVDLGRSSTS